MTPRGATVAEALVALLLSGLVVQGAWGVLAGQIRASRTAADTAERLDAARVGRYVLGREIRAGRTGRDWLPPVDDSISLRGFRGVALACPSDDLEEGLRVRYRGVRGPDPEKDSVLLLLPDGAWIGRALEEATAAPEEADACSDPGDGWSVERWRVEGSGRFVLARLFERGSYHVADGALRYRRGNGGRQPLTPEILDDHTSGLRSGEVGRAVHVRLDFLDCRVGGCARGWEATLRSTAP